MITTKNTGGPARWRVAAVSCTTAAAVVLGVVIAPAAQAAPQADPVGDLLGTVAAATTPSASGAGTGTGTGTSTGTSTGTGTDVPGLVSVGDDTGSLLSIDTPDSGLTATVGDGLATVGLGTPTVSTPTVSTPTVTVPGVTIPGVTTGDATIGGSTTGDATIGGSTTGGSTTTGSTTTGSTTTGSTTAGSTTAGSTTAGSTTAGSTTGGSTTGGSTTGGSPAGGSSSAAPAPAATAVPKLISATIGKSMAIIYPKKDGYRDSMSFFVQHGTSTGAVVPVTGTALLTKAGKTVKSWTLVKSTQTLAWNGLIDGALRTGAYTLKATAKAADGVVWKSATGITVSAKKVVTKAASLRTGALATSKAVHRTMPKAVRNALAKGLPVTVRVTTAAKGLKGTGRLVFSHGTKSVSIRVKNGTHTSSTLTVPKTATKVNVKPVLKAKHGKVSGVKLVWHYGALE